ncbi:hypothetical protein NC652_024780 [Populus alba x Populus x berolinensis]|uniref:Uncharacterized protein n=1 Tax=Populus alba x Populus x berolinensis TaxID=444605 RepID=A0AAD6M8X8_9ROSI|nr:hypothetical protein NC652_024778 [Populus alba x Populus x berolinensis]KAJ6898055.1 hypothetical protein NC652_024780 [Populus alba x Populus x berolinensis]KAJ6981079.1 hypothetical protein NC653_024460 [Populus alba x Populus x berolinensis]
MLEERVALEDQFARREGLGDLRKNVEKERVEGFLERKILPEVLPSSAWLAPPHPLPSCPLALSPYPDRTVSSQEV